MGEIGGQGGACRLQGPMRGGWGGVAGDGLPSGFLSAGLKLGLQWMGVMGVWVVPLGLRPSHWGDWLGE